MGDWHRGEIADVVRELRTDPAPSSLPRWWRTALFTTLTFALERGKFVAGLARGRSRE